MQSIGLDIGTTSLSVVLLNSNQTVEEVLTAENNTFLPGAPYEKIQDAREIERRAFDLLLSCQQRCHMLSSIGITGQMHGIVYLNRLGNLVSPLYTWQDGRGNLPYDDTHTWAEYLSIATGYSLSTGYGLVTHAYNVSHHLVPDDACVLCTIHDYIAMKLAGLTTPLINPTNAASFGCYDSEHHCFDPAAIAQAGIDPSFLPEIMQEPLLGVAPSGIRIFGAIGDNQASYLGAVGDSDNALLLNIGTGAQLSIHSSVPMHIPALESRPYMDGGCLLVGATLCGGRSYALLEKFFRETVRMVTGEDTSLYPYMDRMLSEETDCKDCPQFYTTFQGTRQNPALRGSIRNLSTENFTPRHFMVGMLYGMAEELHSLYRSYLEAGGRPVSAVIGAGNSLRSNPHLCRIVSQVFQSRLEFSPHKEEAACGAALFALWGGKTRK